MYRGLLAFAAILFGSVVLPAVAPHGSAMRSSALAQTERHKTAPHVFERRVNRPDHYVKRKAGKHTSGPAGLAVSDPGDPYHIKRTSKVSGRKK
jgi:hypothetical protein